MRSKYRRLISSEINFILIPIFLSFLVSEGNKNGNKGCSKPSSKFDKCIL